MKKRRRRSKDEWTITDWEGWLWKTFSQYIRLRDCIKTTGTITKGKCVTCQRIYSFDKLQAGHFIPGRTRAILFDDRCTNIQCYRCNVILGGNWPPYYRFMQREYGQEIIEELISLWGEDANLNRGWFERAYDYYNYHVTKMKETGKLVT